MSDRLAGKVAIITGAASGQGKSEVDAFRNEGAIVIGTDISAGADRQLDVTNPQSWKAIVNEVVQLHGKIDVLVNNAGVLSYANVEDLTIDEFQKVMNVNLYGAFYGLQAVVPHMPSGSSIINVSSLSGLAGQQRASAYSSSKFALRGFSRSAALDLAPKNIRVNAIFPGVIRTPMISYVVDTHEEQLAQGLPLGRIGEPTDIAAVAVFLASDDSIWMTGAELVVDGGQTAGVPKL